MSLIGMQYKTEKEMVKAIIEDKPKTVFYKLKKY